MVALSLLDTRTASDDGVWFTLQDLDGNEIFDEDEQPVQFLLAGKDSAIAKEAFRKIDGRKMTDEAAIGAFAKCVLGWSNNLELEPGEKLDYSPENVRKVLRIPAVQDWVLSKVIDRSGFTTAPKKKRRSS